MLTRSQYPFDRVLSANRLFAASISVEYWPA